MLGRGGASDGRRVVDPAGARAKDGVVAATAGAFKDLDDGSIGPRVKSPIFAHARFERLEAEGAARVGPRLRRLVRAVKNAPGNAK